VFGNPAGYSEEVLGELLKGRRNDGNQVRRLADQEPQPLKRA